MVIVCRETVFLVAHSFGMREKSSWTPRLKNATIFTSGKFDQCNIFSNIVRSNRVRDVVIKGSFLVCNDMT